MIYRFSVGCTVLLTAALLAPGCVGSFGVGTGSAAPELLADTLTGDWVLDPVESDPPLRAATGEGRPGADGGRVGGAGRGTTGFGGADIANREAVATLFTIASERPSGFRLAVSNSTFRIGRSASVGTEGPQPLNLRFGAVEQIYRTANVSVTAHVNWRGRTLRVERTVNDAGTVTDSYSVDRYGRLIVSKSLSLGRNPGNRSVRFVYRRVVRSVS